MTHSSSPAAPAPLALRIERHIRATRQRVYDAWTKPELLQRWSAPKGLEGGEGTMDLRVGGGWSFKMLEPDGRSHQAFGTYLEIVPLERLVYTHAWRTDEGVSPETRLTLEFSDEGDGTRLVLTQTGFESVESRDGHSGGWNSAIDNLATLLEQSA